MLFDDNDNPISSRLLAWKLGAYFLEHYLKAPGARRVRHREFKVRSKEERLETERV